jgi:rRNA maturation RNase YbeY
VKARVFSRLRKKRPSHSGLRADALVLMRALGLARAELGIHLAGRAGIRSLNRSYRDIDRPTDVLSFPVHASPKDFPRDGEFLIGDIVICPDVAEAQAADAGIAPRERMRELLVHGLLHLIGHDHEAGPSRARRMRSMEAALLRALGR